ncbi:hypothetical protein [Streptomyces chilikensis]|uniref:hypothetical protein n=1 Tax=Streptomyces chilikensis TaxID=1194079 RepID=UPI001407D9B2|nr:hypothetical protein [Streptomyces chilikensis]
MAGDVMHHWILVLDVENFSSRRDPVQRRVRAAMYRALDGACDRAGLSPGSRTTEDRGDGALVMVGPEVSPLLLVGPLMRELDEELLQHAEQANEEHALRLRVALHQGPAGRDGHGWSGDAVNTAFRLVDAPPLREVLTAATASRMVLAVSDGLYRDVVRHAHRGVDPASFLPFEFTAKHDRALKGWITAPGYPAPPGLRPAGDAAGDAPARDRGGAGGLLDRDPAPRVTQSAETVQGDMVAGDKNQTVRTSGDVRL